jgi:hypothetical protein
MAFDWGQYLVLARSLLGWGGPPAAHEAAQRSAVSRVYYAAFCNTRNYARDWLGFVPRNDADDHGRLRDHLKRRKRWAVASRLDQLRQWRNECDYLDDLAGVDLAALGTAAVAQADYIFQALTPPTPPRP